MENRYEHSMQFDGDEIIEIDDDPLGLFTENPTQEQLQERQSLDRFIATEQAYTNEALDKIFGHGRRLTDEEREKVARQLAHQRLDGATPMDNELPKSQEFGRYLEVVNSYINQELEELGLDRKSELEPQQFHLISFLVAGFNGTFLGSSTLFEKNIQLNHDLLAANTPLQMVDTMIHEAIHANAFERVRVKDGEPHSFRSGYEISYGPDNSKLKGLNEAVVERMTLEILRKHKGDLNKEFGFTGQDWDNLAPSYQDALLTLDNFITEIARLKDVSEEELWTKLKRGEFTGEMIHLKNFAENFGSFNEWDKSFIP